MKALVSSMIFALVALSGAAQGQVGQVASNAAAGHEKARMCIGCHGISGWRTAYPEIYSVPMIYGQHSAYIIKALHGYKSGERSHPSMRAIAGSLSEQDMADLAAYYGAAAPTVATK